MNINNFIRGKLNGLYNFEGDEKKKNDDNNNEFKVFFFSEEKKKMRIKGGNKNELEFNSSQLQSRVFMCMYMNKLQLVCFV